MKRTKATKRTLWCVLVFTALLLLVGCGTAAADALPSYVTVERTDCSDGCWRLVDIEYLNEDESGGLHHIFFKEPHSLTVQGEVCYGGTCDPIPLDKPASEPAGNFPMYGGGIYSARIRDGPSDTVHGLRMGGQFDRDHDAFYLTFEWEAARAPPTATPQVWEYQLHLPLVSSQEW